MRAAGLHSNTSESNSMARIYRREQPRLTGSSTGVSGSSQTLTYPSQRCRCTRQSDICASILRGKRFARDRERPEWVSENAPLTTPRCASHVPSSRLPGGRRQVVWVQVIRAIWLWAKPLAGFRPWLNQIVAIAAVRPFLAATPTMVNETATRQLSGAELLDDLTNNAIPAASTEVAGVGCRAAWGRPHRAAGSAADVPGGSNRRGRAIYRGRWGRRTRGRGRPTPDTR